MDKSKPCHSTINLYHNIEFEGRRSKIESMSSEDRHEKLLEAYPCFNNHVEIIEEGRRILHKKEQAKPDSYMKQCIGRFDDKVDFLIYFGVAKKYVGHPTKLDITAKIIHVIQNLHLLFGGPTAGKSSINGKRLWACFMF